MNQINQTNEITVFLSLGLVSCPDLGALYHMCG